MLKMELESAEKLVIDAQNKVDLIELKLDYMNECGIYNYDKNIHNQKMKEHRKYKHKLMNKLFT
jgi:hypothetical protein